MHIIFTDDEREWLDTAQTFSWKIKDECPHHIKETLSKKLELLSKQRTDE